MSGQLSPNLKRLEAEAIAVLRETAAEFRKPVLLYLIGRKFRDMIAFRDQRAKATPRKSSDQAKDKRALYYRAARHVLERHNSGARPTRSSG